MKTQSLFLACVLVALLIASQRAQSADEPAAKPAKPSIYKCVSAGRVTYSDTACKNAAEQDKVVVKEANSYTPAARDPQFEEEADDEEVPRSSSGDQGSIAQAQIAKRDRCKQLSEQLQQAKHMERELRQLNRPTNATVMQQSQHVADLERQKSAAGCR